MLDQTDAEMAVAVLESAEDLDLRERAGAVLTRYFNQVLDQEIIERAEEIAKGG